MIDDCIPEPSDPSAISRSYLPEGPSDSQESDMTQLKTINQLVQEGGVQFIQYLMTKAISHDDTLPSPSQI